MKKRTLALLLATLMIFSYVAACTPAEEGGDDTDPPAGGNGTEPTPGGDGTTQGNIEGTLGTTSDNMHEEQIVKLLYDYEPNTWNYLTESSANAWANYIDSLVEYDYYGMCQPCLADTWTKSDDNLIWTFNIRQGIEWLYYDGTEYGAELVAEDWVTTAKYILDPANAARTADLLFVFEGAEEYYDALARGEEGDWDSVGIRATESHKLEFTLLKPLPYFLSMLTYNWGYPTNAQFLEEQGDRFGTDNTTILYNGAYLVTDYQPESYTINERNEQYWDIEDIHIERIEEIFNAEAETLAPEQLLRGEVTTASIPTTQIDEWINDPEKANMIRPTRTSAYSYWYLFNFWPNFPEEYDRDNWTIAVNNENFRKSIYYALDRVMQITPSDPYNPEAYLLQTVTPPNFAAAGGKDYTQLGDLAAFTNENQFNMDKAIEYMELAKTELAAAGATFPIQIYMPYDSSSTAYTQRAQLAQQQLEGALGNDFIDITIEGYPSTGFLDTTRRAGNYALMQSYWGPDYADPETYTDPFAIGQKYNYIYMAEGYGVETTQDDPEGSLGFDGGYWKDLVYDEMVNAAAEEVIDLEKRYTDLANAEAWLLDQAFIIPIGLLSSTGYISSHMNPFESQFAAFGMSDDRYKYQYVMKEPMSTEEYIAGLEVWEQERADAIAAAQAAGIDY